MKEQFDNVVANGVATPDKKKYVKPEIEVIPIEVQAPLLAASAGTTSGSALFGNSLSDDEEFPD